MTKYNWSIKKMKNQLLSMKEFLEKNKDIDESLIDDIENEMNNLESAIDFYYRNDIDDRSDKYIDKNHFLLRDTYEDFLQVPDYIQRTINKSFIHFKGLNDTYQEVPLSKFMTNGDDLVDLVNDFLEWLPGKNKIWENSFREFTDINNHLLKLRKNKKDDFNGITHFTYFPEYTPYFLINRKYNVSDFLTLLHELAHGTVGMGGQWGNVYPSELEGWYFQFLGRKFLDDKNLVNKKDIKQLEYDDFSYIYESYICIILLNICHKLKCNKKALSIDRIKKLVNYYFDYFYLDKDLLKSYLDFYPIEKFTYIYSYLLNLDLEMQYEHDPELSFYNFNRVVIYGDNINDNTVGLKCLNDDFSSLDKKVEKINKF